MADYYPLLVRALSSLPQKTGEHRKAVYDRARTALLRQLRGVDPPLPEGEIIRERQTLEEAIRRAEADFPADPLPMEPARPPEPARPAEPVRRVARFPEPAPEPPEAVAAPEPAPVPAAETEPAAGAEASDTVSPAAGRAEREPRRRGEADAPDVEDAEATPRPGRAGAVRSRQAAAASRGAAKSGGASWQKLVLFALIGAVIVGALAVLVINRAAFLGDAPPPATTATPAAPADQPKNAERLTPAGSDTARRPTAPARAPASGVIRAQLLEESPDGSTPQSFEGTVNWKTESFNAGPGLPPDIGIRADIAIPDRQIAVSFVIRRNVDQTLPASHTIDIGFKLPPDFAFGGIGSIPFVGVKPNLQAQGVPLSGLPVRINPTFFLVGLSPAPAERQRNLMLLQRASTFELPIIYTNNKRAKISFEKGTPGTQIFTDVFTNWGELLPPPPETPPAAQGGDN